MLQVSTQIKGYCLLASGLCCIQVVTHVRMHARTHTRIDTVLEQTQTPFQNLITMIIQNNNYYTNIHTPLLIIHNTGKYSEML